MFKAIISKIAGDPNKKVIEAYTELVDEINALESSYEKLSDEELSARTGEFKARLADGEDLDDLLIEAFATVREVSKRTLGMRHYDVQLIGGIVLHQGKIAEMRTGEGKTLMATLPMYLNALVGKGVHLVTVNDYLARRDARWMAPIFDFLGMQTGVLQMGSRTENGRKAFIVDLSKESPQEDSHQLDLVDRNLAYKADITYGTNNEFGFDYLRDNMSLSMASRSQRGHHYAIIDEVDNVLIDEARTPLIISGPSHDDAENYVKMSSVVKQLRPEDYEIEEKDRTATLTDIGVTHVEQILGMALSDPDRPEDITPEQARMMGYLEQAMRAQFLFKRNKDYLVQGGQVIIIDEFTGRLMPGRRWSDGLHQAVEAKEGVKVQSENITHATITIQNYFRMYEKLAGMTGTAMTEAEEFNDIYELDALPIPPNVEYMATREDTDLVELQNKDEFGYEYTFYATQEDAEKEPLFWKRKDYPDVVFRTEEAKLRAIVEEVLRTHIEGRPILLGTTSVENSERLSNRLKANMVQTLLQTLLLRYTWFDQNQRGEDGRLVMALSFLYEPLDKLNRGQMNQLAKQLNINLNLSTEENIRSLLAILGLGNEHAERLKETLKRGVSHQVLNARKHTEESQIIAGAGAFGAVTIATNMAGRGVDIKLGGEMAEEILTAVNRVLRRTSADDPYEMSMEERLEAVRALKEEEYGIYSSEIRYFMQSTEEMEKVKVLGGLHVIGSERHDARRIDNQLRGRAARQGDPGSSRFYLSLEDELMRLFGGQQVDNMMQRLKMDDALPLEHNLVSRVVEQSQTRVEGANFDARKHLLEYDDVLNSQRATVYAQRDRIFTKEDLSEDVAEMLQMEVERHVPLAFTEEEGAWKILAWLEQIQPSMVVGRIFFPSFTYKLLMDHLKGLNISTNQEAKKALLDLAERSILAEEEYLLRTSEETLEQNRDRLDDQIIERLNSLDTFTEALRYSDETDTRSPKELADEAAQIVRMPLNLSNNDQRLLREDSDAAHEMIAKQVENFVTTQMVVRMIGAVERRLNESLDLTPSELVELDWNDISQAILDRIKDIYTARRGSLLGEDGPIARDIDTHLGKIEGEIQRHHWLQILLQLPQGERLSFDKKTHRQIRLRTTRLVYQYYAAEFIEAMDEDEITDKALDHLEEARKMMVQAWGLTVAEQNGTSPVNMLLKKNGREKLAEEIGAQEFEQIKSIAIKDLAREQQQSVLEAIGRQEITETYRQLILRVISELWIEYLTQMEALRVSIGLEAYGQRDPLVQYKARASEMFAQLFQDMRTSVVNRMFAYRPRQASAQPQVSNGQPTQAPGAQNVSGQKPARTNQGGKRKRRRKR